MAAQHKFIMSCTPVGQAVRFKRLSADKIWQKIHFYYLPSSFWVQLLLYENNFQQVIHNSKHYFAFILCYRLGNAAVNRAIMNSHLVVCSRVCEKLHTYRRDMRVVMGLLILLAAWKQISRFLKMWVYICNNKESERLFPEISTFNTYSTTNDMTKS